jgi:hypothetical protein
MTPQEIFEYKNSWKPGYRVQVDIDSDVWGKDYCRKHLGRHEWTFDQYTRPDDSHTFAFEKKEVALQFFQAYNKHNPKFPTGVE